MKMSRSFVPLRFRLVLAIRPGGAARLPLAVLVFAATLAGLGGCGDPAEPEPTSTKLEQLKDSPAAMATAAEELMIPAVAVEDKADIAPTSGSCVPKTCRELGIGCGLINDGCGRLLNCGGCAAGQHCGGGGPHQCGTGPGRCGDGTVDFPRELCDGSICCPFDCQTYGEARPPVCRPANPSLACDVAETCSGVICPPDRGTPDKTKECRPADSKRLCDVAEKCDGVSPACPPDVGTPDTKQVCWTPPAGPSCGVATTCDGRSLDCPTPKRQPPGFPCRPSDPKLTCDAPELCDGSRLDCPVDVGTPDTKKICWSPSSRREACIQPVACDGHSTSCPAARPLQPAGTVCEPSHDPLCDAPERCDGYHAACPVELPKPTFSRGPLMPDPFGNGMAEPGEDFSVDAKVRLSGVDTAGWMLAASSRAVLSSPLYGYFSVLRPDATLFFATGWPGVSEYSCLGLGTCFSVQGRFTSLPRTPHLHWDVQFDQSIQALRGGVPDACGGLARTVHIGQTFGDVLPSSPYYDSVERLVHRDMTVGCGGPRYCPSDPTLRQDLAGFVSRYLVRGGPPTSGTVPGRGTYDCRAGGISLFSDVAADDMYCAATHYLAQRGLTRGCAPAPGFAFCPLKHATRRELLVFAALSLLPAGEPLPPAGVVAGSYYSCATSGGTSLIADLPASDGACAHAHYLLAHNVLPTGGLTGCPSGSVCPDQEARREVAAYMLSQIFALNLGD